jgi:hypothetical protein
MSITDSTPVRATRARRPMTAPVETPATTAPAPVLASVSLQQPAPAEPQIVVGTEPAPIPPPNRKPFGAHVLKLQYPERAGYHRHWFKDTPGRIDRATEAGYAHVKGKDGKNVAHVGGVAEHGGKQTLYMMEIPLEWYRADQALKDARRDEIDAKIKRSVVAGSAPGQDGSYVPVNKAGTLGADIKMHGK